MGGTFIIRLADGPQKMIPAISSHKFATGSTGSYRGSNGGREQLNGSCKRVMPARFAICSTGGQENLTGGREKVARGANGGHEQSNGGCERLKWWSRASREAQLAVRRISSGGREKVARGSNGDHEQSNGGGERLKWWS